MGLAGFDLLQQFRPQLEQALTARSLCLRASGWVTTLTSEHWSGVSCRLI